MDGSEDTAERGALGLPTRFREQKVLGAGAQGRVVRAHDRELDRAVVVKVQTVSALGGGEESTQRFLAEARILASLRHPRILPLLDHGLEEGLAYHVFPESRGESLEAALEHRGGRLPARELVPVLRDLAEALAYLHGAGLVHRDVKPGNVLIEEGGRPVLIDFGLARVLEETAGLTATGVVVGTPAYLSPGVLTTGTHAPPDDVYALGVVAFQCLAGRRPFEAPTLPAMLEQLLHEPPPDLRQLAPAAPADLCALVATMLEKRGEERPTAAEVAADLAGGSRGPPAKAGPSAVPATSPAGPSRSMSEGGSWARPAALVATTLLAAALGVGWLRSRPVSEGWVSGPSRAPRVPDALPEALRARVSRDRSRLLDDPSAWMAKGAFLTFRTKELFRLHPGLAEVLRWNRDRASLRDLPEEDRAFLRQVDSDLAAVGFPRLFRPHLERPTVSAAALSPEELARLEEETELEGLVSPGSPSARQALRLFLATLDEVRLRGKAALEGAKGAPRPQLESIGLGRDGTGPMALKNHLIRLTKYEGATESARAGVLGWFQEALRLYRAAFDAVGRALAEDPLQARTISVFLFHAEEELKILHLAAFADLDPSLVLGVLPREPIGLGLQGWFTATTQLVRELCLQDLDRDPEVFFGWLEAGEAPAGAPTPLELSRRFMALRARLEGVRALWSAERYVDLVHEVFPRLQTAPPGLRARLCASIMEGLRRSDPDRRLDVAPEVLRGLLARPPDGRSTAKGLEEARRMLQLRLEGGP